MSLQNYSNTCHDKNCDVIDYDFYDSNLNSYRSGSDFIDMNEGVKEIQIKPLPNNSMNKTFEAIENEVNVTDGEDDEDDESDLIKCIAYEDDQLDGSGFECISKSSIEEETESPILSPLMDVSVSDSPSSDLTNVTPYSVSSSCSSAKGKKGKKSANENKSSKLEMKLLSDAVESLSLKKNYDRSPTHSTKSKGSLKPNRKNMTFSNEELRKIDQENERLLKKILSFSKSRTKSVVLCNTPPVQIKSSAAINRLKQQRQINQENFVLLQRIHNVKPTQSFNNRN